MTRGFTGTGREGAVRWVDESAVNRRDWERDPTAAELAAYLQARPDLAVEVVGLVQIVGPWAGPEPWWQRRSLSAPRVGALLASVSPYSGTVERGERRGFSWSALGHHHGRVDTIDEARAAADAALVAAGWALVGGAE